MNIVRPRLVFHGHERNPASCEIILTGAEPAAARHERSYLFCGAPPARHRRRVALHLAPELAAVTAAPHREITREMLAFRVSRCRLPENHASASRRQA